MQYLFSVIHDQTELASEAEQDAIVAFNAELRADGHWVFAGGLGSPTRPRWSTTGLGRPS
jgi:hypothetical protein